MDEMLNWHINVTAPDGYKVVWHKDSAARLITVRLEPLTDVSRMVKMAVQHCANDIVSGGPIAKVLRQSASRAARRANVREGLLVVAAVAITFLILWSTKFLK